MLKCPERRFRKATSWWRPVLMTGMSRACRRISAGPGSQNVFHAGVHCALRRGPRLSNHFWPEGRDIQMSNSRGPIHDR